MAHTFRPKINNLIKMLSFLLLTGLGVAGSRVAGSRVGGTAVRMRGGASTDRTFSAADAHGGEPIDPATTALVMIEYQVHASPTPSRCLSIEGWDIAPCRPRHQRLSGDEGEGEGCMPTVSDRIACPQPADLPLSSRAFSRATLGDTLRCNRAE